MARCAAQQAVGMCQPRLEVRLRAVLDGPTSPSWGIHAEPAASHCTLPLCPVSRQALASGGWLVAFMCSQGWAPSRSVQGYSGMWKEQRPHLKRPSEEQKDSGLHCSQSGLEVCSTAFQLPGHELANNRASVSFCCKTGHCTVTAAYRLPQAAARIGFTKYLAPDHTPPC